MPYYRFDGSLTRCGPMFLIYAETPEGAKLLAKADEYAELDESAGEFFHYQIDPDSCEVNE